MPEIAEGSHLRVERIRQKQLAYLGMRLVEAICCLICAFVHIEGFLHYQEPFPHEMLFCGLYAGYFLISFYSFLFHFWKCCALNYLVESVISGSGFLLFIVSAFVSMYHAETDIHLQYLSDDEEGYHRFFVYCRLQSLGATITAQIFLIHCCLSMDLAGFLEKLHRVLIRNISGPNELPSHEACEELRLHPFWIPMWTTMLNNMSCDCCRTDRAD
ncbi:uncharacterized protein LOC126576604 [Anopheles aquasalis]|uniref:uncharacterized protein LOC126576604 n=1 Tax=Anopheles aquasalis TaxID=42839 RepID=UPI00215AAA4F|nr:uncharacterized protein LOC126576604 [Anopheles aquasalis]